MNPTTIRSRYRSHVICLVVIVYLCSQAVTLTPVRAGQLSRQNNVPAISPVINGCSIFPENNIWNTPIADLPVHERSDQWVNTIGRGTSFHMDFGSGTWNGGPIGIPYNIVGGSVPKVSVSFDYEDESDAGPYPIPANPLIEHGSDHHILIVDNSTCTLYELFDASYSGGAWHAGSGAIWNMNSNALRPDTWTSADAAGLPILPGLVRYDEILSGEINHAIRFTAANTNGYIWPARHLTSNNPNTPHIPPMGARFRLKASFDISSYPAEMQVILNAMKTYGIILADNGSNWYVSGTPDSRWDNDMLHLLDDLTGNDFEAVDSSVLMVDYDSGATGSTISGNVGRGGVTLSYIHGTLKMATSSTNGDYSFFVSDNWSGTVTPSLPCFTFTPTSISYSNVTTHQTSQDYTASFDTGSDCANIDVSIAGNEVGNYGLPSASSLRAGYAGVDNGPVKIGSTNSANILSALRVIWREPGFRASYSEMMGLPVEQLSTEYWFPWYNNLDKTSMDQGFRIANVDTSQHTIRIFLGATQVGTDIPLAGGGSIRVGYEVNNGPIRIVCITCNPGNSDDRIIAALRVIWKEPGRRFSYSEMMGLPKEQLSTEYWFPWYNNAVVNSMDQGLRIANISTTETNKIEVWVGNSVSPIDTITLTAGASVRVGYNVDNGPIRIVCTTCTNTDNDQIIPALRVIWKEPGFRASYSEMMGLPKEQLSDEYWFPWYNNAVVNSMDQGFRIANVSTIESNTVEVWVGTTKLDTIVLDPGASTREGYNVDNGPIRIVCTTCTNSNYDQVLAALRVIWKEPGFRASYSEMMGLPSEAISTEYWFPWYNFAAPNSMDQGFRIAVP